MNPDNFDPNIAHIVDGPNVFQVLNQDGTDWDEAATRAAYEAYLASLG
jgi:hypothetical protein